MKKAWQRQESRLADLLGGECNAGSGNGWSRKNDVRSKRYQVEAKLTEAASFRLRLADLQSLASNADREGRTPVLAVEIQGRRYVVLREQDWEHDG